MIGAGSYFEISMAQSTLQQLLAQKAALEKQIAEFQQSQRSEAIAKVKAMMAEYGITLADVGGAAGKSARRAGESAAVRKTSSKVAVKYRNPATGDTWSGRGLKPRWLTAALAAGRSISDFAV